MHEVNLGPHLVPLAAAAAATRMAASGDGAWVVAELSGRWLAEEFTQHQEAPPVLKLIDARRDAAVASASGWMLGRPGAKGALYLATHGAELTYRLSWLAPPGAAAPAPVALPVPAGIWAVKASFPLGPDRAALILWRPASHGDRDPQRREELWLATLDTGTGELVAQATRTALTPRAGSRTVQVGATGGPDAIYLVDHSDGAPRLLAFDASTLAQRWSTEIVPRQPVTGDGAALAVSGDASHVLVVLGNSRDSGVSADAGYVVAAADGKITAVLDSGQLGAATRVQAMAPGQDADVVWSAVLDTRGQRTDALTLAAITAVDTRSAGVASLLDTSDAGVRALRDAVPVALALDPDTRAIWVALPARSADGAIRTGRHRPEVDGMVDTPGGWYQPGRPNIDAWLAAQR